MGVVYRQKGRSTWMLKYYRDGRPIYESSGSDVKDEAKRRCGSAKVTSRRACRLRRRQAVCGSRTPQRI
jgi:hypothetical protein